MSLLWRVFATNAAVLVAATLVLVLSPATVSFPVAVTELLVLVTGLGAMLAIDLVLLRRAFGPLRRLTVVMRGIDPLRPGGRAALKGGDAEVAELGAAFDEMLDRLETERRESARRALAAEEGERLRIARELHDEVGQALAAVVMQLDRLSRAVGEHHATQVERTRETVRLSLEELRGIARRMRPEALDDLGLRAALTALTNDVTRQAGLRIARDLPADLPSLLPDEELVVYRVAQESLTNAVRHASPRSARVSLSADNGAVELVVSDDGCGFDPRAVASGGGLRGMRERAVVIGADLEVRAGPGEGTRVRLRLARRNGRGRAAP